MDKVFELLGNSTGIDLCDDLANQVYPMPTSFIGDELTHVGRVRKDLYKDKVEFMLYDEKYYEKIHKIFCYRCSSLYGSCFFGRMWK